MNGHTGIYGFVSLHVAEHVRASQFFFRVYSSPGHVSGEDIHLKGVTFPNFACLNSGADSLAGAGARHYLPDRAVVDPAKQRVQQSCAVQGTQVTVRACGQSWHYGQDIDSHTASTRLADFPS
eukprot:gnl/TRDRNA2_/TRDRNA2_197635_c0_seq1.p1 gnl/TRDRNA2_/TRDRNA2_197635_c0~~gnl/TRDRNA2_/TRDRNA2_197635_c0_seq1.p1  ORF type:complete len:123 (+),score=0.90 gnl/TRDRNA2_/TRDRNA2_197635_c0_seq1:99-467(+)